MYKLIIFILCPYIGMAQSMLSSFRDIEQFDMFPAETIQLNGQKDTVAFVQIDYMYAYESMIKGEIVESIFIYIPIDSIKTLSIQTILSKFIFTKSNNNFSLYDPVTFCQNCNSNSVDHVFSSIDAYNIYGNFVKNYYELTTKESKLYFKIYAVKALVDSFLITNELKQRLYPQYMGKNTIYRVDVILEQTEYTVDDMQHWGAKRVQDSICIAPQIFR